MKQAWARGCDWILGISEWHHTVHMFVSEPSSLGFPIINHYSSNSTWICVLYVNISIFICKQPLQIIYMYSVLQYIYFTFSVQRLT